MQECTVHTCANGLTALVWPRRESPVVSVRVWVESGSMHEAEYAQCGISHLTEHMVFKGTQEYSAAQLNEKVAALGGLWNAYTGTDRTVYHIDGPAERWREFLHILAQLTLHPTFPEEEWMREREVIRREMAMYRDDPDDVAYRALIETLYKKHPRRYPVIGLQPHFDALSLSDLKSYHAAHYVPGNMFVCIVGDIEETEVIAGVEAELGSAPPQAAPHLPMPEEPRQWGPRLLRREFPQPTSTLMLAWRIPHANHEDMAPLALLSAILGDGRCAWLYRIFHDERGAAHDVSTLIIPQQGGEGALVIEADVDRDDRDTLRDALLEYVATLSAADYDAALDRTLRQLHVRHLKALSTVQGAADVLGGFWRHSRNTDTYAEWRRALECVTSDDLRRVAREYLTPHRLVEVSVDPEGSNADQAAAVAAGESAPLSSCTLSNGLRYVSKVDKRLPMVYATLALGAGCRAEDEQNSGVSMLLAECLAKGTATRNSEQIAAQVEDLGATLHCSSGNNTILLTISCLTEDAPAMLELLADLALHPSFPEDAVQTEREDMLMAIREDNESPVALAFSHLRRVCYGPSSYGLSPTGSLQSVASLSREDLVAFHQRIFCAQNAVLSLVGDFDPDQMDALVDKHFAAMPAGAPLHFSPTPPQQAADESIKGPRGKEQAVLLVALPGLPLDHADKYKLLLLSEWCQDMAGPIFSEIRERRGLAYNATSALLLGVDAGCIFFELETAPDMLPEARSALESVLSALARHGLEPADLERARATALSARALADQSPRKLCSSMAVNELLGLGADYSRREPEALRRVTHEQMRDFMRSILSPDTVHTWVTLCP